MRTPIAFRAVAALALATGLSAAGVTAAFAVDIPAPCLAILDPAARQDCIDQAAQAGGGVDVGGGAGQAGGGDSTGSTGGETSSGGSTGGGSTGGGSTGGGSTGGTGGEQAPPAGSGGGGTGGGTSTGDNQVGGSTPAAPAAPAAPPAGAPAAGTPAAGGSAPAPAPAPANDGAGATSSGSSSGGSPSAGSSSSSGGSTSASSSDVTVTAAPAVPVAPSGPALTQAQSTAGRVALEEARRTLPTTVEPNTRLLAGNTASEGSLIPSPDDSGLLALIIALGAASAGCAVAAGVLRRRSKPRHLA